MEPQVGSTIGDYQVIDILGAGGMGKVYKVRNTISDRVEAMKVLLPDLASAPELADRFLREIKVQASLEHPNIASLHTAIRIDNQLVMLMEFVDGVTLEHRAKEGPIPVPQAVDYIRQVLSALEYAHAHGVIHRDIKPANMMLTPGGVVKLMDFGIAKAANDHKLTMTGTTMGSLYYMSPEQIQGATTLDARADLYSLGVSLYELVTGKRPFDGDSQFAIMSAHLQTTPVPPIELDPKLPQMLNDVILMSVMKDPGGRFQTATAFRNALGNVILPSAMTTAPAAAPAPAPAPFLIQPTQPANSGAGQSKSKRGLWMAIGALAAAAAVIGVIELAPWKGSQAKVLSPAQTATTSPAPAVDTAPPPQPAPTPAAPAPTPVEQPAAAPTSAAQQSVPQVKAPSTTHTTSRSPMNAASQVAVQQPMQQPVQSQPQQVVSAPPTQQPAAPQPDPHRVEMQELREKLVTMDNRAQSIHGTLNNMQRAQAAQGFGLGGQYTGPAGLMDSYLRGANDALNAGDVAAARSFLEKAGPPIAALEKLLNK
jgi:serine/threonine protein kinase